MGLVRFPPRCLGRRIYCGKLNTGLIANTNYQQPGGLSKSRAGSGSGIYCAGSPTIINNLIVSNVAFSTIRSMPAASIAIPSVAAHRP